jgi:hypothetical protein
MGAPKRKYDPNSQDQDQDQKQANLQAQLQGQLQGQGQAQGQAQLAVQSLDSKSDNKNSNDNKNDNKSSNDNDSSNDNKNGNFNANVNDNKVDNSLDNKVDNNIDNKVQNVVDNKVNVDVNVDLDLKANGLSSPVIDLSHLQDNYGNAIVPQVVTQTLDGNGNQFDIQQVNNLVDNDVTWDAKVSFTGSDFHMDGKIEGGDIKMDHTQLGDVIGNTATGVTAHADATLTQDAFNQTITQGANIQFNSITLNAAGHDLTDSHNLGS